MSRPVRVTAVVMMSLALAACVKTVDGSVAMTTEPGPPITSPTATRPTSPTTTETSEVPAPANAKTMTCEEFSSLDKETRLAVVKEILAEENSMFGPLGEEFAEQMASSMCQFLPDKTVAEVLLGSPPP